MTRTTIALACVALSFGLAACSSPSPAADTPKTFTMTGSIRIDIARDRQVFENTGTSCFGAGGYSDITPGAAVIVQDGKGNTVATGALEPGTPKTTVMNVPVMGVKDQSFVYACTLPFTVPGVPDGLTSYSVTVSHRGTRVVQSAEAHSSIDLSIGGN